MHPGVVLLIAGLLTTMPALFTSNLIKRATYDACTTVLSEDRDVAFRGETGGSRWSSMEGVCNRVGEANDQFKHIWALYSLATYGGLLLLLKSSETNK